MLKSKLGGLNDRAPSFSDFSGFSVTSGFTIKVHKIASGAEAQFFTPEFTERNIHQEKQGPRTRVFLEWFFTFLVFVLFLAINKSAVLSILIFALKLFFPLNMGVMFVLLWLILLAFGTSMFFSFLLARTITMGQQTKEWHALEHKCIQLMELHEPITEAGVKRVPALNIWCGMIGLINMQQFLFFSILFIIYALCVLVADVVTKSHLVAVISAGSLVISSFSLIMLRQPESGRISTLLLLISAPALILPLIMQSFVLKNPSEDKIKSIIRPLNDFIEENNLYRQPS